MRTTDHSTRRRFGRVEVCHDVISLVNNTEMCCDLLPTFVLIFCLAGGVVVLLRNGTKRNELHEAKPSPARAGFFFFCRCENRKWSPTRAADIMHPMLIKLRFTIRYLIPLSREPYKVYKKI